MAGYTLMNAGDTETFTCERRQGAGQKINRLATAERVGTGTSTWNCLQGRATVTHRLKQYNEAIKPPSSQKQSPEAAWLVLSPLSVCFGADVSD